MIQTEETEHLKGKIDQKKFWIELAEKQDVLVVWKMKYCL